MRGSHFLLRGSNPFCGGGLFCVSPREEDSHSICWKVVFLQKNERGEKEGGLERGRNLPQGGMLQ